MRLKTDDIEDFNFDIFNTVYPLPLHDAGSKTREQILLMATIFFAKKGYASVSMRDLAKVMGMQQSSLYNHFANKEALWREVLEHARTLYMLYFDQLDKALEGADTFEAVLEVIFHEPKRLANVFTCYAFCMIQSEQLHDEIAGGIFIETFLCYGIDFLKDRFDVCVARGLAPAFDTRTVATIIMHSVFGGLQVGIHTLLGHVYMEPYRTPRMFADLQRFILRAVKAHGAIAP